MVRAGTVAKIVITFLHITGMVTDSILDAVIRAVCGMGGYELQTSWNLNDFINEFNAKKVKKAFSYSSGKNSDWETVDSLRSLIKKHVDSNFKS